MVAWCLTCPRCSRRAQKHQEDPFIVLSTPSCTSNAKVNAFVTIRAGWALPTSSIHFLHLSHPCGGQKWAGSSCVKQSPPMIPYMSLSGKAHFSKAQGFCSITAYNGRSTKQSHGQGITKMVGQRASPLSTHARAHTHVPLPSPSQIFVLIGLESEVQHLHFTTSCHTKLVSGHPFWAWWPWVKPTQGAAGAMGRCPQSHFRCTVGPSAKAV